MIHAILKPTCTHTHINCYTTLTMHMHAPLSLTHMQSTQPKSPVRALRALSAGAVSRRLRTRMSPRSATYTRSHREPELGDLVLVSDNVRAI